MSKELNNKIYTKSNIFKKQIFDCCVLFIIFGVLYYCHIKNNINLATLFVAGYVLFITISCACSYIIKKDLDNIMTNIFDKAVYNISEIQNKNNFQKQKNIESTTKIQNITKLTEELQQRSREINNLSNETRTKTNETIDYTNNEYNAFKANIDKMFAVRHKIQTIAELVLELTDTIQSISSTIGLIEDIAEQTNLLALNAAVEAARAGEHGKGFAVVAGEIRKLADESKQATTKITSLINDIQQTATNTVLVTEEGNKEIESGLDFAQTISENMEKLVEIMKEVSKDIEKLATSSQEINKDTLSTNTCIKEMSQIIEDSQKITNESGIIFEKIESVSDEYKNLII